MNKLPKHPSNPLIEARMQLEFAENLRQDRNYHEAKQVCDSILGRFPNYSAANHTLGLVYADMQDYTNALINLVKASMLNPNEPQLLTALAGVYLRLGSNEMAMRTLNEARGRDADDISILMTLGELYREESEYALAATAFREVSEVDPDFEQSYQGLGQSCIHLGDYKTAIVSFEKLLSAGKRSISLLYSLSQVPVEMRSIDVLPLLDEATGDAGKFDPNFEILKAFTNAALLDQKGEYQAAWDKMNEANQLVEVPPMANMLAEISFRNRLLGDVKRHPVVTARADNQHKNQTSTLFILGPSRAGKTTLEFLIGSFKGVKRGFENPSVEHSVKQAFLSDAFPPREQILELPPPLDDAFRKHYFEEINKRADGARIFTNTHPGLVQSVLRLVSVIPDSRFLFVKRDADDIALRIFMKKYRAGNFHSYNLEHVREYISWYYEMIDLLAERLPDHSRVIKYEDLIENPAAAIETAKEICDLGRDSTPALSLGDDRGCAAPYHSFFHDYPERQLSRNQVTSFGF